MIVKKTLTFSSLRLNEVRFSSVAVVGGGPLLLMVLSSPSLGGKEDEVGEGEGRGRLFCPSLVCSCCWASSCGADFIHLLVAGVSQLKLDVKSNFMQRKKVNISNRFEIRELFFGWSPLHLVVVVVLLVTSPS